MLLKDSAAAGALFLDMLNRFRELPGLKGGVGSGTRRAEMFINLTGSAKTVRLFLIDKAESRLCPSFQKLVYLCFSEDKCSISVRVRGSL